MSEAGSRESRGSDQTADWEDRLTQAFATGDRAALDSLLDEVWAAIEGDSREALAFLGRFELELHKKMLATLSDLRETSATVALESARAEGDRGAEDLARFELAQLAAGGEDLALAESQLEDVVERFRLGGNQIGQAYALVHLGPVLARRGDRTGAQDRLERARRLFSGLGDLWGEAAVLQAMGEVAEEFGDVSSAIVHLSAARGIFNSVGEGGGELTTLMEMARLTEDEAEASALRSDAEEILRTMRKQGWTPMAAYHSVLSEVVETFDGRIDEEITDVFSEVLSAYAGRLEDNRSEELDIADAAGDPRGRIGILVAQAKEAMSSRDYRAAVDLFGSALDLVTRIGDAYLEVGIRVGIGESKRQIGDLNGALDQSQRAFNVACVIGDPLKIAEALRGLCLLTLFSLANFPVSLTLSVEAVRAVEKIREPIRASGTRRIPSRIRAFYSLALDAAYCAADDLPDEAGRAAIEVAESARAGSLADLLRAGGVLVSGKVGELLDRICLLETQLADVWSNRGSPGQPAGNSDDVENELNALRNLLERAVSAEFVSTVRPARPDVDAICGALAAEKSHALIFNTEEAEDGSARGHVVWITPSGVVSIHLVNLQPELVDFIGRFERRQSHVDLMATATEWHELRAALLPETLHQLVLGVEDTISLVVVPDWLTQVLPFCALRLENGQLLIEHALVRTVPSLGLFAGLVLDDEKKCRAGTVTHFDSSALSTIDEANAIASLRAPFTPVTSTTTRAEVLAALGPEHLFWAIGAHCDPGEGFGQSLRLASGEVLSAGALLGHGLPEIVSLGSCFGARLPLGLATTCLTQGTRTVLGPLLDVEDEVAGHVLAETYRLLPKLPPAEALRAAQLDYVSSRPEASPRGWAILVALGL